VLLLDFPVEERFCLDDPGAGSVSSVGVRSFGDLVDRRAD
jgi:hypothetical protein